MTITYADAVPEMYAMFFDAWKVQAPTVVAYLPEVRFADDGKDGAIPDRSKFWVRISIRVVDEGQSSLNTCEGAPGQRRWRTEGLVFIQLYAPKTATSAAPLRKLAEIARNAFRGQVTPGGIWFRNARVVPVAPEEQSYRTNAVIEFNYDEQA